VQWRLQEISVVSAEECCSDLHIIILPKNYSVTGALTYICNVVIFTIIFMCNVLVISLSYDPCHRL
jgi:hypothetical protein